MASGYVVMPFGRHRGEPLDELPHSYLRWLLKQDLREPLRSHLREEAQRREADEQDTHEAYRNQHRHQAPPRRHAAPPVADVDDVITSGVRALAKKYHPDLAGGDLVRMQQINHAADWLRSKVRELLS
jgi:hypothetical protein